MADKELAAKLAKRLAVTGDEGGQEEVGRNPPPPPPDIPKKMVENPFVPSDFSFSVDDLILKTLEAQEENNNYQKSLNSPVTPAVPHSPISPSKSPLPLKQTIRDWLLKDQPQPVNAVAKQPIIPVEHNKHSERKPQIPQIPQNDGSELEKKLAAQRAKKSTEAQPVVSVKGEEEANSQNGPLKPPRSENKILDVDVQPETEKVKEEEAKRSIVPVSAVVSKDVPKSAEQQPSSSETPEVTRLKSISSFEELEEQIQRELEEEEKRKQAESVKMPPLPKVPPAMASPLPTKKSTVPSPLLMEAIRAEDGIKAPPPPTTPKPSANTPTGSRPQSPVVKKPIVSPLGLFCDPLMSIEQSPLTPLPQSPKPVKKVQPENPEELEALLERQRKINDGEHVPQFVNRKLSIYHEFPEFTKKQIKSLTDTFKKYDEDGDGYIDFNELKRMMEKLGEAQTHVALKEIIKKVDEDGDGKINIREFFLLFRLAAKGELGCSEVFNQLAENIDVSKEGVLAAASFFQAKIAEQTKLSKFEEEIKQEQEERKREEEEKKIRREKFLQSKSIFH